MITPGQLFQRNTTQGFAQILQLGNSNIANVLQTAARLQQGNAATQLTQEGRTQQAFLNQQQVDIAEDLNERRDFESDRAFATDLFKFGQNRDDQLFQFNNQSATQRANNATQLEATRIRESNANARQASTNVAAGERQAATIEANEAAELQALERTRINANASRENTALREAGATARNDADNLARTDAARTQQIQRLTSQLNGIENDIGALTTRINDPNTSATQNDATRLALLQNQRSQIVREINVLNGGTVSDSPVLPPISGTPAATQEDGTISLDIGGAAARANQLLPFTSGSL